MHQFLNFGLHLLIVEPPIPASLRSSRNCVREGLRMVFVGIEQSNGFRIDLETDDLRSLDGGRCLRGYSCGFLLLINGPLWYSVHGESPHAFEL
jgi:hypothetical protein